MILAHTFLTGAIFVLLLFFRKRAKKTETNNPVSV